MHVPQYGTLNDSCAGALHGSHGSDPTIQDSGVATVALIGLRWRRCRAQATKPAGRDYTDADVRFMQGMIMHHAQAVVMSDWAATHGARPDLVILCQRIALVAA